MKRVAVLVDGENLSADFAAEILRRIDGLGRVDVKRVYGNAASLPRWDQVNGFRLIHSGSGKNSADLLMAIDGMEFSCSHGFEVVVICSSDGDHSHLAARLVERGVCVVGMGEDKTPTRFRAACSDFELLQRSRPAAPAPKVEVSALDRRIKDVIEKNGSEGATLLLKDLNGLMRARYGTRISTYPEKNWRTYLGNRPQIFKVGPRGPDAVVRVKPGAFCQEDAPAEPPAARAGTT
ncbi:Uncharacterized conserved protein, LabA/DUF88 family [Cribrihabitans marinus]|uniref:Uncharacterized conserved protein, LabA/DUF88 family n=1 Tax=Cribrihabitans marinus TaxID=1227549 RepID=A0A1H6ZYE5_9RHOB|nr:NYN domain-containing protein [Cribrihabitans marinus]GGH30028.1 hypothetical protein GCM10010973_19890 [Cribrihabitans marinus]SEJ56647.1 Uncharacterized conserved protein, LabA/DUF88 family [Cribrihabitans marinus]